MTIQMTITEALAEVKLINEKIEKKRTFVLDNLTRIKQLADPLQSKGGSMAALAAEMQSINDLEARLVEIRAAIMHANMMHTAECMGMHKTLYGWLVWKREIAGNKSFHYQSIYTNTKKKIDEAARAPSVYTKDDQTKEVVIIEANLPYMEYAAKYEDIKDMLNKLDGVLSLKNATVLVELNS
jgi:hypothetical protein